VNAIKKYWKAYKWSNIFAMLSNNKKKPAVCSDRFQGKLVVLTGATSGIGYYTARKYAEHGAHILTINRNKQKSEALCEELQRDFGASCSYILADLSTLDAMHHAADELAKLKEPIAVLIHNAGVFLKRRTLTTDGLETTFAVHYLAPFVINYKLQEKFMRDKTGRIIFVNSEGHRFAAWGLHLDDLQWEHHAYSGLKAYGSAKLAQLLTMHKLADMLKHYGITVNAMHPGMVKSNTGHENDAVYKFFKRNMIDSISQSAEISAQALYYLGVSSEVAAVTDTFFNLTTPEEPAPPALDLDVVPELWDISMQLGKLK